MFRKITFIILLIIDIYLIYSAIGYAIMGNNCPEIVGEQKSIFMGNYIMSIIFGSKGIMLTIVLIILGIKTYKKKKQ